MAEKSMRYECVLTCGDTRIATGSITIVCVRVRPGEPMKAVPFPPEIAARFAVAGAAPGAADV
jgi:acyl-CoA thioesterase FadM